MGYAGAFAWIIIMVGIYMFFPFENFITAPDEYYILLYAVGFGLPILHLVRELTVESNFAFTKRRRMHSYSNETKQTRNDVGGHRHFHSGKIDEHQRNDGNHLS